VNLEGDFRTVSDSPPLSGFSAAAKVWRLPGSNEIKNSGIAVATKLSGDVPQLNPGFRLLFLPQVSEKIPSPVY